MVAGLSASRRTFLLLAAMAALGEPGAVSAADVPMAASGLTYVQTFADRNATGEALADAFFGMLSLVGSPAGTVGTTAEQDKASRDIVEPYLDPAFLLQRASGERYTAQTYVPADVDEFEIGDVRETRPTSDVVVVRYSVRTTQSLPDAALIMSTDKAPRLTVFHWSESDSRWKILSHANFNTPVAAICDRKPVVENILTSPASPEDQALGQKLMKDWFALAEAGNILRMLSPMIQLQTAGGHGYTTLSEHQPVKVAKTDIENLVVTRNGDLMVLSLYAKASGTQLLGAQFGTDLAPRLYTFLDYGNGAWRLIASAYFNIPAKLPEEIKCVPPGKLGSAP